MWLWFYMTMQVKIKLLTNCIIFNRDWLSMPLSYAKCASIVGCGSMLEHSLYKWEVGGSNLTTTNLYGRYEGWPWLARVRVLISPGFTGSSLSCRLAGVEVGFYPGNPSIGGPPGAPSVRNSGRLGATFGQWGPRTEYPALLCWSFQKKNFYYIFKYIF